MFPLVTLSQRLKFAKNIIKKIQKYLPVCTLTLVK